MTLITSESSEWLTYIDHLQRRNAEDLAFYPLSSLEKGLESGHIRTIEENGQPAGYLWFGLVRSGQDHIWFQTCIDYDLRRQHLGFKLVAEVVNLARAGGATGIRFKCASSAPANVFWQAAGFYCTRVTAGGIKRGRDLNHYRMDITPTLLLAPSVVPSEKPIDLRPYQQMKRLGVEMPSRFSRTHYNGEVVS